MSYNLQALKALVAEDPAPDECTRLFRSMRQERNDLALERLRLTTWDEELTDKHHAQEAREKRLNDLGRVMAVVVGTGVAVWAAIAWVLMGGVP